MNCSKCIHFKRCLHLGTLLRDGMIEEAESFCGDFEVKTDVVEVVRCKGCKMFVEDEKALVTYCKRELKNLIVKADDFCSYGERR